MLAKLGGCLQSDRLYELIDSCVVQIMVPGKTNVSLTLSWSTDYDPIAAAQQPGAAKQGPKGDSDSEVMLLLPGVKLGCTISVPVLQSFLLQLKSAWSLALSYTQ